MRWGKTMGMLLVLLVLAASCGEAESELPMSFDAYPPMEVRTDRAYTYSAIFTTSVGRMTFNLYPQEATLAVNNFMFLGLEGFFDDLVIYRVLPGVLAETGDQTGTGTGGPGYTFEVEPPHRAYARGDLVMANDGSPNSNGSRFFILFGDIAGNADFPGQYTIIGSLKDGHKPSARTLAALEAVAVGPGPGGEVSLPVDTVQLTTVAVTRGCPPSSSTSYSSLCN